MPKRKKYYKTMIKSVKHSSYKAGCITAKQGINQKCQKKLPEAEISQNKMHRQCNDIFSRTRENQLGEGMGTPWLRLWKKV